MSVIKEGEFLKLHVVDLFSICGVISQLHSNHTLAEHFTRVHPDFEHARISNTSN